MSNQPMPTPDVALFLERSAIREIDGGEDRETADREAAQEQGYRGPVELYLAAARAWAAQYGRMSNE